MKRKRWLQKAPYSCCRKDNPRENVVGIDREKRRTTETMLPTVRHQWSFHKPTRHLNRFVWYYSCSELRAIELWTQSGWKWKTQMSKQLNIPLEATGMTGEYLDPPWRCGYPLLSRACSRESQSHPWWCAWWLRRLVWRRKRWSWWLRVCRDLTRAG